jgi:2,4-didehydro-3-deoxy-L-rhamnonate hydrolase
MAVLSSSSMNRRASTSVRRAGGDFLPTPRRFSTSGTTWPRQIFAIGLNYSEHADETGLAEPADPLVFTKFASALSGPVSDVVLPAGGDTDWEVELVVVIAATTRGVSPQDAWDHVAGLTIGQDISERVSQFAGAAPQFSLGKSFAGFAPTGPFIVTPDELDDPDSLAIRSEVNGITMQAGTTRDLIVPVADLIAYLSRVVTLYPGDMIFTGTPAGVGLGRSPAVYLQPGDVLTSEIEGLGQMKQRFISEAGAA